LPNTNPSDEEIKPRSRRKFLRWIFLACLIGGVIWLNGPGLRWLAPIAASHFLGKSGLWADFSVEGSLSGGLSITNLKLASGDQTLAALSVDRVKPLYQFSELLRGNVRGIEVDGARAELRLGVEKPDELEKAPPDLEMIVRSLRQLRTRIVPLSINLRNISLTATRDGRAVLALAKSELLHAAGDPVFKLGLGPLTDASGKKWPAQSSSITWNPDALMLDQLAPLPGIGLRGLIVTLPESGGPAADAELHINDAVFVLAASPGFTAVSMDLREGRLDSRWLAESFALKLPATAELSSLSLNLDELLPALENANGSVRLLLENVVMDDWRIPELSVDAALLADRATVAASGHALDTGFSITAEAPVSREAGGLTPAEVRGQFHVEDVAKLVAALSGRFDVIDPAAPAPQSVVDGDFTVALEKLRPVSAEVDLNLKPADPEMASPLGAKARWQNENTLNAMIDIDGLKATAGYHLKNASYEGSAAFDGFRSARIDHWLAIVRADTKGAYELTGTWSGGGEIQTVKHRGLLELADLNLAQEGRPPVRALGELTYDWPVGFSTRNLSAKTGDQTITADARLADGLLVLGDLRWLDGEKEILKGSSRLPVPADFSKWRETLAHDTRPVEVNLVSAVLPLDLLKDWLPAASKIDPRSTGRVSLKVSGTYADPVVDAVLEAKDLRSPQQPKLPPADLRFAVSGSDGRLAVNGSATAPDFPAATMTASMPFLPADWAEDPDSMLGEKIVARVDLPRLDLSRFASLVAPARKLTGIVTGNIEVAGELGKPDMKGRLDLTGGTLELKDERIAAVSGIGVSVDLALDRITLRDLRATLAGGTLRGGGTLALAAGKPANMDFRVAGNHLPLLRNDSMIVRANADLRLTGDFEQAALTGSVGVVDSLFYRDIELLPMGTPFTTPSAAELPRIDPPSNPAAALPEPFNHWTLDVRVRTDKPFLIRGNFATGKVAGNLRIGGTLGNPSPDGELRIADLKAALPFSTLTVRSGTLLFTPATGFDPVLEIRGTSDPRPYRVNAYVYGRASDPQLVLTSSPPLPENEIMTLLATGTTTSGLEDPQAASSRAMQLLVEELRRGRFAVGRQLRPLLGMLDRVDFSLAEADPYSNESFSTATLSITDRWFLSAGMGADGDSRILAIWRLTFH
jgi:hypothetical protein